MTNSWSGVRVALVAAVLIAGAACQRQDDRQARGDQRQQQAGSSGSQSGTGAMKQAEKSSQQAADAQDKAADAQKQVAGAQKDVRKGEAQRTVQGKIVRASQDEIVLRQGAGEPDLRLKVSPRTTVTMNGQQKSVGDLQEGTQVRASYDESGGAPQATKIEATTSGR